MSMLGRLFGFGRDNHYDKGIRLFDQGLFEEAVAELQLARKDADQSGRPDAMTKRLASFYVTESYVHLGTNALQQQQYEKARVYFGNALAINPLYADLHFHYGRASRKVGDLPAAAEAFQKSLDINPRFAKSLFSLALVRYTQGEHDAAIVDIRQAVDYDPGYRTEELTEALAAHEAGEHDRAYRLLEGIVETEVDDIAFYTKLGRDLFRRGMYAEATKEFERALSLNPNYADIHNHLAVTYNARGLYPEALAEFHRALDINPDYSEARTNLALTLRAAGQDAESRAAFEEVLRRDPENIIARENLA